MQQRTTIDDGYVVFAVLFAGLVTIQQFRPSISSLRRIPHLMGDVVPTQPSRWWIQYINTQVPSSLQSSFEYTFLEFMPMSSIPTTGNRTKLASSLAAFLKEDGKDLHLGKGSQKAAAG